MLVVVRIDCDDRLFAIRLAQQPVHHARLHRLAIKKPAFGVDSTNEADFFKRSHQSINPLKHFFSGSISLAPYSESKLEGSNDDKPLASVNVISPKYTFPSTS